MAAPIAYIGVIVIWATTPLAIKISNTGFNPVSAATGRFVLAALLACILVAVLMPKAGLKRSNWRLYLAGSIGLFPNMPLVYWAAEYIPSGLLAVIFATSPLTLALCSLLILKENLFTPLRSLGLLVSLIGLALVLQDQLAISEQAWIGIALMLLSNLVFSLSNVLVKKQNTGVNALEQTLGSLVFAVPGFMLCWLLSGAELRLPGSSDANFEQALWALGYLALIGSILGSFAFFTVLRNLSMAVVALIPLISPVISVIIGAVLAGEHISPMLFLGSAIILSGIAVHEVLPRYWRGSSKAALSANGQASG